MELFSKGFTLPFVEALTRTMKPLIAYPEELIDLAHFKGVDGPLIIFVESGIIDEYVEGE